MLYHYNEILPKYSTRNQNQPPNALKRFSIPSVTPVNRVHPSPVGDCHCTVAELSMAIPAIVAELARESVMSRLSHLDRHFDYSLALDSPLTGSLTKVVHEDIMN